MLRTNGNRCEFICSPVGGAQSDSRWRVLPHDWTPPLLNDYCLSLFLRSTFGRSEMRTVFCSEWLVRYRGGGRPTSGDPFPVPFIRHVSDGTLSRLFSTFFFLRLTHHSIFFVAPSDRIEMLVVNVTFTNNGTEWILLMKSSKGASVATLARWPHGPVSAFRPDLRRWS